MKYGCRAHDYGCFTAKGLADVLTANGYNAAQLAMPKAIRGIPNFTDITPAQLTDIRTAFAEAGIEISVLSCYQDLSNPDTAIRENAVAAVCRALHYQKAVGAKHVGSESACRDLTEDEKAATLPLLTDSILRIVEQAAKIDACFVLEPVFVHTLGTVEKLRTLKEAVADHDHFHIIFDPVNVLTAADVSRQAAFWPAWCEVIGKDLACVHVKDAVFHPDAPRTPTALGAGQMDYTVIREWLHRDHPIAGRGHPPRRAGRFGVYQSPVNKYTASRSTNRDAVFYFWLPPWGKLSAKQTDEGRRCNYNPFTGNNGKRAPHPAFSRLLPREKAFLFSFYTTVTSVWHWPLTVYAPLLAGRK